MYQVEILRIAIEEMEDAYDWYELQVPGLGDQFINEVEHYIELIKQNPNHFATQFSEQFFIRYTLTFPFSYRLFC